jgi:perosamine synthetase
MVDLGYNYRLPDINCALGLSQLKRLDQNVSRRRELAAFYNEAFSRIEAVKPLTQKADRNSAWHLYVVKLDLNKISIDRKDVFSSLRDEGIGVNVHYIPVYWHPYYQKLGYKKGLCPVAERAYEEIITLPLFYAMSDNDVSNVVAAVRKVVSC